MRDSELRGLILEALNNQRRKDLVNLDQEVGGLPRRANSHWITEHAGTRDSSRASCLTASEREP